MSTFLLFSLVFSLRLFFIFFFFNDTATTEIYTLSLHDALPISVLPALCRAASREAVDAGRARGGVARPAEKRRRSEEHTSELQSRLHLVCRLLLEKKKKTTKHCHTINESRTNRKTDKCVCR